MINLHINLHIIHLTLEFKYESRIGLTMLKKSQKYDKALMKSIKPKNASQNDQNPSFMMQI